MNKIFFIPVGLPGLGKTTFAKHLMTHSRLNFKVINYDEMLLNHQKVFQAQNPNVAFHQVIDIVRHLADKEYLQSIKLSGSS